MPASCSTPARADNSAAARIAAREALAVCGDADRIAEQAASVMGVDDERLFALLDERERMLAGLASHIAALAGVKADAGALVDEVLAALSASERTTAALAAQVTHRVTDLRGELLSVQRAGSARLGYATLGTSPHVDRVR